MKKRYGFNGSQHQNQLQQHIREEFQKTRQRQWQCIFYIYMLLMQPAYYRHYPLHCCCFCGTAAGAICVGICFTATLFFHICWPLFLLIILILIILLPQERCPRERQRKRESLVSNCRAQHMQHKFLYFFCTIIIIIEC